LVSKVGLIIVAVVLMAFSPLSVSASGTSPVDVVYARSMPNKTTERGLVAKTPERHYLAGLPFEFQRPNNCAVVTTNMMLGYYGTRVSQAYTAGKLRPHPADVSVSDVEMINFARVAYGYGGERGWGGDLRLLEAFVANGIPVVVLQPLELDSDLNHFRIVRGYDRVARTLTLNDSYFGQNLVWGYDRFEALWARREYSYVLIYPRGKRALVRDIRRRYRDDAASRRAQGLELAQQFDRDGPADGLKWLQFGDTMYHLGRYKESLRAWERANELGIPEETLWYVSWPVEVMNRLGRYAEAHALASDALEHNPASAEMYYERARAHHKQGQPAAAREDLAHALRYAPYHPQIRKTAAQYTSHRWAQRPPRLVSNRGSALQASTDLALGIVNLSDKAVRLAPLEP